ncbi:MAG: LysM peptidoglycan-binding domain-containing protein [Clostridiales bacterium]|nr:LysM peptidoglycan-binding domain-containing protein [Clostridiales bacterium]
MKTARYVVKVLILIFCFTIFTGFTYVRSDSTNSGKLNVYAMYINDTELGTVKSAAKGLKLYDEVIDNIRDRYSDDQVYIKADIYFKEVQIDHNLLTSEELLKKALEEAIVVDTNAYAIVIDGKDVCYLKTREEAVEVLENVKLPYKQTVENKEDTELDDIEFKEKVDIQERIVMVSSIADTEKADKIIRTGTDEIKEYEIDEGDTLWEIAKENDLRVEDLMAANPDLDPEKIKPGQKIKLQAVKSLLTVVTREKKVYTESIPYETVVEESSSLYKGEKKIKQKGQNGEKEIHVSIVRENGKEVSREKISEKVLKEPVKQIELKGTKSRPQATTSRNRNVTVTRPSDTTPISKNGVEMTPWFGGANKIFARGSVAKITHVDTGYTFYAKRRGGTNHADCEPLTAADTAVIKKIYGGKFSWTRKAIIVQVNGKKMAASMNGMPHGGSSISGNNFSGHFCIHFYGSRTHGSGKVDADHQAMVKKAAGQ